jgi:hypothetical protein
MTALRIARGAMLGKGGVALCVAVAGCLSHAAPLQAQMSPYESSMRGRVGTGFGQEAMAQGGVFQPRVETAVQYVNNINLAASGSEAIDTWGIELAPGFYASYSSDSITAAIDYSIAGRAWDDSDYNDVSQIGSANGRWVAVPEYFYLDAQASISDAVIDPALSLNYGGLGIFGQDNLSQVATAGITPTFDRHFGDFNLLAQYSYGRVWYFDQGDVADQVGFIGQDDSRDQSAYLLFGNSQSGRKLTGDVYYSWQKTDYDNALPYNYEQLGTNVAWQVAPSTALVGGIGLESDLTKSTTSGGLDSSYWDVGFRWEPDDRTYFEARYGDRFFGSTYFLSARRTVRLFEFTASYSESPQVQTQILSLGSFNPGELPPGSPDIDFGRLNSDPFVGKNASMGIAANGSRTSLGLTAFQNKQDFIRQRYNDDTYTGATFWARRQLASNLSASFSASYVDYEQNQPIGDPPVANSSSSYDTTLIGRLNRESSGGKLTTSLEAGFLNSAGSEVYDGWWVGLRARWQP